MTLPSAHQRNRIEPLSTEPQAQQTRFVPQRGCGARACIARQYDGRGGPCGITAVSPPVRWDRSPTYLRALTLTCRTPSLTRSAGLSALLLPPPTAPSALTAHWARPPLRSVRAAQRAAAPSSPSRPPLIARLPMLRACRTWRAAAASRAPCHAACCPLHAVTAPPGWAVPGFQIGCATAGWCRPQAKV